MNSHTQGMCEMTNFGFVFIWYSFLTKELWIILMKNKESITQIKSKQKYIRIIQCKTLKICLSYISVGRMQYVKIDQKWWNFLALAIYKIKKSINQLQTTKTKNKRKTLFVNEWMTSQSSSEMDWIFVGKPENNWQFFRNQVIHISTLTTKQKDSQKTKITTKLYSAKWDNG